MYSLRLFAVGIAALMLSGVAGVIASVPDASAQGPGGYVVPRYPDASTACPDGTSETFVVAADIYQPGFKYCTPPAEWAMVTSEDACATARADGVTQLDDSSGGSRGWWMPTLSQCFGGGLWGATVTSADCPSVFVADVTIEFTFGSFVADGPYVGPACVIPIYELATGVVTEPPSGTPLAGAVEGNQAELAVDPTGLDPAANKEVLTNPLVYNGPLPADGIIRFTIPDGFEDAVFTLRTKTLTGASYVESFTFAELPAPGPAAPTNRQVVAPAPTPPPELEMKLTDPYTCGGGFSGEVENGQAPYMISYRIEGQNYSADLGNFVSPAGVFETPEGYLDYSQIPDGIYSVSIRISDSSQWTRSIAFDGFATEHITDDCGDTVPSVVAVPAAQPADNEQPVGLAVTGATTDAALLISQLLLGLGLSVLALLRLAPRRQQRD